jgi:hypothetical protein
MEKQEGENDPVGLILCARKSEVTARYVLGGLTNKVFASQYQLAFPSEEQLMLEMQKVTEKFQHAPPAALPALTVASVPYEYRTLRPLLEQKGFLQSRDIQKALSLSRYAALRLANKLVRLGLLRKQGAGRGVEYRCPA